MGAFKKTAFFLCMALVGCNENDDGVSNSGSTSLTVPALEGVFLDSPVEGLKYKTATQSGVTDAKGTYKYLKGEVITFTLYDINIGSAVASAILTPFDMQGLSKHSDYALNMIRLLMTIDSDKNPDNGIQLPVVTTPIGINLNQSMDAFSASPELKAFISKLPNVSALVSTDMAVAHYSKTLSSIGSNYSFELKGKKAKSVITHSKCSVTGGFQYAFSETGFSLVGSDGFRYSDNSPCKITDTEKLEESYADAPADILLACGSSVCDYKDVNKVVKGIDADGRGFISSFWHTPGTRVFSSSKAITSGIGSGIVFREDITIDDYTINLLGKTATSVITNSRCSSVNKSWNYAFDATGFTLTGDDRFPDDCSSTPSRTIRLDFSAISNEFDVPFNCGSATCSYSDLNKTIRGKHDKPGCSDFVSTYSHTPGTNIFEYTQKLSCGETIREVITLR